MIVRAVSLFSLVAALLAFAACKQLELSVPSSTERVLAGVVKIQSGGDLPRDAEVTIQIVDLSRGASQPDILGEQTVKAPAAGTVPFRIEFHADDALLLRGVAVDARVSVAGKLRYATRAAHPITVANVAGQHVVNVEPATQP
jgi:putative lipoprotein